MVTSMTLAYFASRSDSARLQKRTAEATAKKKADDLKAADEKARKDAEDRSKDDPTKSDAMGMDVVDAALDREPRGLIFVNLVDFDTQYGHRNDPAGYASNLERFDVRLRALLPRLDPDDLLVITADHGNDPTTPSTDHAREYVPLLVTGTKVRRVSLGTRPTFSDLGQTIAENFGVPPLSHGTSFLEAIRA